MEFKAPSSIGPLSIGMTQQEAHRALGGPGQTCSYHGDPEGYVNEAYLSRGLSLLFERTRGLVELVVNSKGTVTMDGENLLGLRRSALIDRLKTLGIEPKFDRQGFFTVKELALGGRVYKGEVISVSISEPNFAEIFASELE